MTDGSQKFQLAIIGQGSAAFAAAIKANDLKIRSTLVGGNATKGTVIGGTCVNVGCIPSKRLLTVGTFYDSVTRHSFEGIRYGKGKLNFTRVIEEKDRLVKKLRREKYANVLKRLSHVIHHNGKAKFLSKNEVEVNGEVLWAENFLIASGARAHVPLVPGLEEVDYLTNEEALDPHELPKSMGVIGGRTLGLEFAQMYAQFGTKVTILQRSDQILPEHEPEVSSSLTKYLREFGITIHTSTTIDDVKKRGKDKVVGFTVNSKRREMVCDQLLFATGRQPNTDHLGLERVGVKTDEKGFIVVNDEMQTSASHVWAAGDVIGEPMLETVAAKEGVVAIQNAFSKNKNKIDFDEVPAAVFTYPEVASVGLTEAQTAQRGIRCGCRTLPLDLVPKAHIIGDTRGLVKMVIDADTRRIVGLHIIAPHAADLIHEGVFAVKNKLTVDDIIDTVHVFPTLSEGIKLAAQSFYKDVGQLSCCTE